MPETGSVADEKHRPAPTNWPERLSVRDVSPAAGSAAAITAALGVGLLIKLARHSGPQDVPAHDRLLGQLLMARDRFLALAEADASVLDAWMATRQLREDDPERQAALRAMVEVPLEAAEICVGIRRQAQPLLERGHPPARPDGEVGAQLLQVSERSLCELVGANVAMLRDPSLIQRMEQRLAEL